MGYIIFSIILLIASFILERFSFAFIFQLITTCMFCGRYAGVVFKKKNFFVLEIIGLCITFGWKILRKKLVWYKLLAVLGIRGIFILMLLYHMKAYMFITKEIKLNNSED